MLYRIGEFAGLSGVSAKTLRYYDDIGLLRPANVDSRTGYRHYTPEQLQELASIRALKDLGVSLAEIRLLVSRKGGGKDQRRLLLELKGSLQQSMETARQSLQWVDAALREVQANEKPIAVIVKRRPSLWIASVRAKVKTYADITRFEQELWKALPQQAVGNVRGVLWHRCADSGFLEGEPFVELKERVPARSVCDLQQLPAATLACAYAPEDDDGERVYQTLRRWMSVRGYRLSGPKREIYLHPMLEIQFPITSA
jgi:DNA-binding transcriptional MerR regulator